MEFQLDSMTVSIRLKPGIYRFGGESAEGKTFLLTMLKAISEMDSSRSICALTYDKNLAGIVEKKIVSKDWDIIMLDRLDLYFDNEICQALLEKQDKSIILIDIKNNRLLQKLPSQYVELLLTEDRIEVSM